MLGNVLNSLISIITNWFKILFLTLTLSVCIGQLHVVLPVNAISTNWKSLEEKNNFNAGSTLLIEFKCIHGHNVTILKVKLRITQLMLLRITYQLPSMYKACIRFSIPLQSKLFWQNIINLKHDSYVDD